jgi:stage II sporulation protein P
MRKRFKNKRKFKTKLLSYILIFILFNYLLLGLIFNGKTINVKDILLQSVLKEIINENNYFIEKLDFNLTTPKNILYASLNKAVSKDDLAVFSSNDETDFFNYEKSKTEYIEDPNPISIEKPLVYIYNTHQLEGYSMNSIYDYSIKPNVMIASYVLKEKLNDLKIPSIVETANIKEYLAKNRLNYNYSYQASRYFMKTAVKEFSSIKYFFDIHRDSTRLGKTLYKKDGKEYAKILFVVGQGHRNYKKNLENTKKLNQMIIDKYPKFSRGILRKGTVNGNGKYNQDIGEYAFLLELGGVDNTIEQVYNTCELIAPIIKEFIKEAESIGT